MTKRTLPTPANLVVLPVTDTFKALRYLVTPTHGISRGKVMARNTAGISAVTGG